MRTSNKININARCERAEINKTEKHCARTIKGVRERGVNHDVIALASGRSALGLLHSRCVYITIASSLIDEAWSDVRTRATAWKSALFQ
jgi:hypothetical protein